MTYGVPVKKQTDSKQYWGPRFWYLLHKITYTYPVQPTNSEFNYYHRYFCLLQFVIPCTYCASFYRKSILSRSFRNSLSGRQEVIDWFRDHHNRLNQQNGGRIYQGFEVDMMYESSPFNHEFTNELVNYLFVAVCQGQINRQAFIHWIQMTYYIHPCHVCSLWGKKYLDSHPVNKINFMDNATLKGWVDGLKAATNHT